MSAPHPRRIIRDRTLFLAAAAILATIPGCGPKVAAPIVAPSSAPVTEEEAQAYFPRLDAAVQTGPAAADDVLDMEAIYDRSLVGMRLSRGELNGLRRGFQSSTSQGGLVGQLHQQVAAGSVLKFLRVREKDGRRFVVCRMLGDDGVNFLEFQLRKDPAGRIRADDVYVHFSGELFSETLRRVVTQLLGESNHGLLASLGGRDRDLIDALPKLQELSKAIGERRSADALAAYRSLPASLQKEKFALLLRVRAAGLGEDQSEYAAALEDFRREHPTDPAVDLASIDHFFLKEDFAAAAESVRRVDEAIGGDAHLKNLRAICLSKTGRFDEARSDAEAAAGLDPADPDAHLARVHVEAAAGNFDAALDLLSKMESEFPEVAWDAVLEDEHYARFRASPAGQKWKSRRGTP